MTTFDKIALHILTPLCLGVILLLLAHNFDTTESQLRALEIQQYTTTHAYCYTFTELSKTNDWTTFLPEGKTGSLIALITGGYLVCIDK